MDGFEPALERLLERIELLGQVTDTPGALTRTFLSPANLRAAEMIASWMEDAELTVHYDVGGTVRGILAPEDASEPAAPLLLGSHLDTVVDAGKYDGALGVLIALAALEITGPLSFPVHLLGFSDEEGVRFHATYLGSRACVGKLDSALLQLRDSNDVTLSEALDHRLAECHEVIVRAAAMDGDVDYRSTWDSGNWVPFFHPGGDPGRHFLEQGFHYGIGAARAYIEVHIEQGRVLEELDEAVCAVSAICGQSRLAITLLGQADHAGTTPMELRRDALAGAAECILAAEKLARQNPALVATVGKLDVTPGASNAIPGEVRFTLDFRHPVDVSREKLLGELLAEFSRIAESRALQVAWALVQANDAVSCDPALTERLLDSAEKATGIRRTLPSGAGHDAVMMATAMPVAMLFVRCRAGLSHHPEEYADPRDIAVALRVLVDFLTSLR
jgi:allantoate deiminase